MALLLVLLVSFIIHSLKSLRLIKVQGHLQRLLNFALSSFCRYTHSKVKRLPRKLNIQLSQKKPLEEVLNPIFLNVYIDLHRMGYVEHDVKLSMLPRDPLLIKVVIAVPSPVILIWLENKLVRVWRFCRNSYKKIASNLLVVLQFCTKYMCAIDRNGQFCIECGWAFFIEGTCVVIH